MGRPYDWSPLGLAADPVPGDPGAIASESGRMAQTARQEQQLAQDQQSYRTALSNAEGELAAAQRILNEATGHRDTAGRSAAGTIRAASHDKLADSWWDSFRESISAVAGHLKLAAQILGAIATAAALAAAVFSGVGLVFLLIAAGLLLTELFIHVILAATGNGSWADVGLDVVALATLGYGGYAEGAAEGLTLGAENAARGAITEGIQSEAVTALRALESVMTTAGRLGLPLAGKGIPEATALVRDAPDLAVQVVRDAVKPAALSLAGKVGAALQAGGRNVFEAGRAVGRLAAWAPGDTAVKDALAQIQGLTIRNRAVFVSGSAIDDLDKLLGSIPGLGPYQHLKDTLTGALPADIGIPVTFFAENWTPAGFVVRTVQWAS